MVDIERSMKGLTKMTNTMTIEDYDAIESELRQIKEQFTPLFQTALDKGAVRLISEILEIQRAIGSLAYMSHPQEEWLGGDSSDPKNFTRRMPHIHLL